MSNASVIGLSSTLPAGWAWQSLGDVLKVRNGFAFKSSDYQKSGVLLIRQSNLDGNKVSLEKAEYLPEIFLKDHMDFRVAKGDVLIGMSGSIGKLCVYNRDEPALQNQRTGLLQFKDDSIKRWIWHYLPLIQGKLHEGGKGVGVQNISASQIEGLPIPIAPEECRVQIVAEIEKQFSRLDEAVGNLKRVKVNLKRYKAAVLKAAVEGKLTEDWRKAHPNVEPASKLLERILAERRAKWGGKGQYKETGRPNVNDLPQLPQHWAWCLTDALFSFVTSGSRGWAQYYSDEGPLFLRVGNLDHDSIRPDLSDVQRVNPPAGAEGTRTMVESGDILISITADVGMIAIVPAGLGDAYINQHVSLARPLNGFCREYLAWYLAARDGGQKMFLQLQRGATKVGLGLDDIRTVPVPLPPLKEQQEIVAEVERRLSVIEELNTAVQANLTRADRLRQSILSQAFSGRLVLQRYSVEPNFRKLGGV